MIHIRYFGVLQTRLSTREEQLPWHGGDSDALLAQLRARGEPWLSELLQSRSIVN